MKIQRLVSSTVLVLAVLGRLAAAPVTPTSYSFSQGAGYGDETGSQLTNGVYADMSGGLTLASSYEFVGWDGGAPSIIFSFASEVTLNQISLSFANWNSAAVYVPDQVKIGNDTFTIDPDSYASNIHPSLNFSGSWTGSELQIDLISDYHRWIFVDEVVFNEGPSAPSGGAVPEATATLPLLALALAGLTVLRRRRG